MRCLIFILTLLLVASTSAFAIPLTVSSNKHNLSQGSSGVAATTETRICVFCHTPHGASADSALWNRNDLAGSFPLYDDGGSGSLHIDEIGASQYSNADPSKYPNGASRMCLSCHDGVSSIGAVLSESSAITMNFGTIDSYNTAFKINLSASHPISFTYNETVRAAIDAAEGGTATYRLPDTYVSLDGQNRMQCTTCHDPHNDTRTASYDLPFWSNTGNATEILDYETTCNDCHVSGDWGGSWGGAPPFPINIH